jgi:hypothetical protein
MPVPIAVHPDCGVQRVRGSLRTTEATGRSVDACPRWRLPLFLHARDRLTCEWHASFKLTGERARAELSSRLPLFALCRALLRWLFVVPTPEPPVHEGVEVVLVD